MKKVTVIIVVYNTEMYLERCLTSVIQQTYQDLEILILDNGCTDSSPEIMKKYSDSDRRIRVVELGRQTVAHARNRGIQLAEGDYITFVDSDDFAAPYFVEKMVQAKESAQAQLAICSFYEYRDESHCVSRVPLSEETVTDGRTLCAWMSRFINLCTLTTVVWNKLFDADMLKGYEFPDEPWGEDMFLVYQCLYPLERVIVIPDKLYYWRENPQSLSRSVHNTSKQLGEIRAYDQRAHFFETHQEGELCSLTLRRQLYVAAQQVYKQKKFNAKDASTQVYLHKKIKEIFPKIIWYRGWTLRTRFLLMMARFFPYSFGKMSWKYHFDLDK